MPGLHITTSNMMEILAARLADVMAEPLASPLDEEIVLINSRGMERWLSMQLAEHHGICANMSFRFPRPFFMDLLEKATGTFGSTALYQPDYLTWKIMKILPETSGKIGFEMIRHYLAPADEGNSLKRYQLARRIAYVFDQYLVYRPEMILNWESLRIGNEEAWQAALWRSLFADAEVPNSAALFNLFRDKIRCSDPGTVPLPERISLIGISALPPLFINMIHFLATVTDIHLFLLNPCREYWSEILSEREMEKRLQRLKPEMLDSMSEEDLLLEKGNPLLASMGKISRDFLFAFADDTAQHQDFFALPGDTTLLRAVQSDILNLADRSKGDAPPLQLAAGDRSLEIHSCHSPMREVEVLYNRLLALFEEDPKLMPRDILVMAPDIDIYAPLIESVFNRTEEEMVNGEGSHIPFSIADRRHARNNPVSDAFFKILAVSESRFEASQVLALLDSPVIRDSFDIAEDETALIRRWVDETGIRWGIDAETLSNLNLPSLNGHTWRHGIDRMLLGYTLPGEGRQLFENLLPYDDIEGERAEALGRFLEFLNTLFLTCRNLRGEQCLAKWQETFDELCAQFLKIEDDNDLYFDYRHLLDVIHNLSCIEALTGFAEDVPLSIVKDYLVEIFESTSFSGGFLSGGVTFCALVPMRSIPFKVICLLGMDHVHFPRKSSPLGFDLIARHPRRGDRSKRDDDRGLFLETLLSARERLLIFYTGQSIRDNTVIPVSVVVAELLDYIDQAFLPPTTIAGETVIQNPDQNKIQAQLVSVHPLQPFSPRYFQKNARLFSYSHEHCRAARSLVTLPELPRPFLATSLPPDAERLQTITIGDLLLFFRNPARFFVEKRLGIRLQEEEEMPADEESFTLKALDRYEIAQTILANRLRTGVSDEEYRLLAETGRLPAGAVGESQYRSLAPEIEHFAEQVRHILPEEYRQEIAVDLPFGDLRLTGQIDLQSPQGLFVYRYAELKGKDYLQTWLLHLILNVATPDFPWHNCLAGRNDWVVFELPLEPAVTLQEFVDLFLEGLTRPLPFFPQSSLDYAAARAGGKSRGAAMHVARKAWQSTDYHRGEESDPYIHLCFEKTDPFNEAFCALAETIYTPLLKYRHKFSDMERVLGETGTGMP